ncbi:MAG: hypothetical protein ING66_15850 [Rhodocyclaceae bacterium]|jgi:hypothetical protein|nr:hypothetical protein [Rhodocyclaceae bacterium]MCA3023493.1 hypothetical protein [Rhodocyclaceae bacterium]MCA3026887.1 hypothetical protein [Rhodocyclaceae bacterium]MCA3030055.1 hypothetical protein [Rhodocyclaceae bacterium]MCA3032939.1 hypothetical protein [Rhodocyclaceae bacterium]
MRNEHVEFLRHRATDYHRTHSLAIDTSGLYTHHVFEPDRLLSWWHDCGFILNKRQIMVWWSHPRMQYGDAIDEAAFLQAGDIPANDAPVFATDPQWKPVGRSRKKIVAYRSRPTSPARQSFYNKVHALQDRLTREGIDETVTPSFSVQYYDWCSGVDLCVPMEIRTHADAVSLIALAKKLLTRQTTCAIEFDNYRYGKADWLREADARAADTERRRTEDGNGGERA